MDGCKRAGTTSTRSTWGTLGGGRTFHAAWQCARWLIALLIGVASAPVSVLATEAADAVDPHAHHHHMTAETVRSTASYAVPRIALVRADGKNVVLNDELDDGRPVVLNFFYTTCTTVCPVTSLMLSDLQRKLGAARDKVHIVSISIDPEQDTPARLREYAARFGAGPEWQHYTGTVAASVTSQRAFDVYRGDKMDHSPVTLLRTRPGAAWVRIEGFASTDQVLAELRPVISASR